MAANDYYTAHPENPTNRPSSPFHWNTPLDPATSNANLGPAPNQTSYEPFRHDAASHSSNHLPVPIPTGPQDSNHLSPYGSHSSTSEDPASTSDGERGLFSSSPNGEKSKSEKVLKFVEKQVRKKIEKKLNGGSGGGHGQAAGDVGNAIGDALGANQDGGQDYGYGAAQDYGAGAQDYGYGFGGQDGGYGPPEGFDFGEAGGNFDFGDAGGDGEGFWEGLGSLGEAFGG